MLFRLRDLPYRLRDRVKRNRFTEVLSVKQIGLVCVVFFLFGCGFDRPHAPVRQWTSQAALRQDLLEHLAKLYRAEIDICGAEHDLYGCQQALRTHSQYLGQTIDEVRASTPSVFIIKKQVWIESLQRQKDEIDWNLSSDVRLKAFAEKWESRREP